MRSSNAGRGTLHGALAQVYARIGFCRPARRVRGHLPRLGRVKD